MANPQLIKAFVAEAAISPFRIVKFGATDGSVAQAAAAADAVIGVADNLGQTSANGRVDVVLEGTADIELGGAVVRGALLVSDAQGRAVTAAPAAGANARYVGIAMVSGVAGDIIPVLIEQGSVQG